MIYGEKYKENEGNPRGSKENGPQKVIGIYQENECFQPGGTIPSQKVGKRAEKLGKEQKGWKS